MTTMLLLIVLLPLLLVESTKVVSICFVMVVDHVDDEMVRAAESFVDFADDWIIAELGDKGNSAVLYDYLKSRGLEGSVIQIDDSKDWSTNRMNAILAAWELTDSEYIFFMDADWDFVPEDLDWKKSLRRFEHITYLMSVHLMDGTTFEYEGLLSTAIAWKDVDCFLSTTEMYSTHWLKTVSLHDKTVSRQDLLNILDVNPTGSESDTYLDLDPSVAMGLGMAYYNLDDFANARSYLQIRANYPPADDNVTTADIEEHFYATYLIALCMERLDESSDLVIQQLLNARTLAYHRVEPLLALTRIHREREEYVLSLAYAYAAQLLLSPIQHTVAFQQKYGTYGRGVGLYGQHDTQTYTSQEEAAVAAALVVSPLTFQDSLDTVTTLLESSQYSFALSEDRRQVLLSIRSFVLLHMEARVFMDECLRLNQLLDAWAVTWDDLTVLDPDKWEPVALSHAPEVCEGLEDALDRLVDLGRGAVRPSPLGAHGGQKR